MVGVGGARGRGGPDRDTSRRGLRSRTVDYRFVDDRGGEHDGSLAPGPGHVAGGRHDLRLLAGLVPPVGAPLTVTYLAAEPAVHAPFAVDADLVARHAELCAELPGGLTRLALSLLVCAWMVGNFVVRLGSHYVLAAGPPRIVLLTRGDNPFVGPDDNEHDTAAAHSAG